MCPRSTIDNDVVGVCTCALISITTEEGRTDLLLGMLRALLGMSIVIRPPPVWYISDKHTTITLTMAPGTAPCQRVSILHGCTFIANIGTLLGRFLCFICFFLQIFG